MLFHAGDGERQLVQERTRGGKGGSSGFLLVLISCLRPLIGQMVNDIEGVTQAKATLPINKNCIKESKLSGDL